jgi:hypothetical protein
VYDQNQNGVKAMTAINDGLKVQSPEPAQFERHNFMELRDGEVSAISQVAICQALAQKEAMGLPINIWNNGNPYRQHSDGRIEYTHILH